jgi:hypothetical protein
MWSTHGMLETARSQAQIAHASGEIRGRATVASILLGVGALAVTSGAFLVLWPEGPSLTVTPTGQALVGYRGNF